MIFSHESSYQPKKGTIDRARVAEGEAKRANRWIWPGFNLEFMSAISQNPASGSIRHFGARISRRRDQTIQVAAKLFRSTGLSLKGYQYRFKSHIIRHLFDLDPTHPPLGLSRNKSFPCEVISQLLTFDCCSWILSIRHPDAQPPLVLRYPG